jgi:hypothetical protein
MNQGLLLQRRAAIQEGWVPPVVGGVTLAAAPACPAPAQGWTVAFADTFSNGAIDTNFWVPNKSTLALANQNHLGDNNNANNTPANNNEYFNSSQVQLDSTGCNLVCIYSLSGQVTAGGLPIDYLSGTITSRPAAITAGYPATGFAWQADTTTMWAFEIVCTLPPTTVVGQGADWNFWTTDNPTWSIEIDFFEIWNWNTSFTSMTPITWIYNTGSNSLVQETYYSNSGPTIPSFVTDGRQHKLTWLFNPSTKTVQPYQDGVAIGSGIAYPSTFTSGWMSLIVEAATRQENTVTATRTINIRSIGAYHRAGDAAKIMGGGLAAGTVVA